MINGTVVIQIAHFFCAYYILKKIFFQPAVHVVQKRQKHLELIRHDIGQGHSSVKDLRRYKSDEWLSCRRALDYVKPDVVERIPVGRDRVDVSVDMQLSPEEKSSAVDKLTNEIMQKVSHD